MREGQNLYYYLILDFDLLPILDSVTCSPFVVVLNGDVDLSVDAWVIHDIPFPQGESVNYNTVLDHEIEISTSLYQLSITAAAKSNASIEPDTGSRLAEAQIAQGSAMVTVLSPEACNEN
ncbi:Cleavage induced Predicted protein [Phytophthora palmivora]|uniref:Uncharacterized protein n=1 Tax=Phytophthora palmivora TaxID=4796 RepID=A0A2P4X5B5_9STRA|nr:Cleavage induced Predicted protein [Phytophthora palmivora]